MLAISQFKARFQARKTIDNLQNYRLGSSRGKSRLLRWLSRWLRSHLHGENDQWLHSSSFLPKLQLSVWLSLNFSLVPYFDADWRPLVCFGPTNRRSKNMYQVSVFSLSDVGDIFCARSSRALPNWQPLRPFSRFSQRTLSFLHIFLFPVTSETASRSLSRG